MLKQSIHLLGEPFIKVKLRPYPSLIRCYPCPNDFLRMKGDERSSPF
jgi:hypothetical protein